MLGDLITLRQLDLPVKTVLFDNGALVLVELEMKTAQPVNYGTELDSQEFADVAPARGLHGSRVENPDDRQGALKAAFDHRGPARVELAANNLRRMLGMASR